MTDYLDYIDVTDEWIDSPLVEIRNNALCINLSTKTLLKNAIENELSRLNRRWAGATINENKKYWKKHIIEMYSIYKTIESLRLCKNEGT